MTGTVIALYTSPASRQPMKQHESVQVIEDYGLDGDRSARAGSKRQVLVMPVEVLDMLGLQPGDVRENITTRGVDIMSVERGKRVKIGEVILEATLSCSPCGLMDDIRPGLQEELRGQRGMLFRVVSGGEIRDSDSVEILA